MHNGEVQFINISDKEELTNEAKQGNKEQEIN